MHSTKMALSVTSLARIVVAFLLPRYPLINALTLLLLLSERAVTDVNPPFSPKAVYVHVGVLFLCALGMGVNRIRGLSALIHACHLLFAALVIYTSVEINYRFWVKIRIVQRMIGVAGFFLLFAYFSDSKSLKLLKRIGEITVGVSLLMSTYTVLQSPEDKEAFLKFVPGLHGALFIYATLMAAIALCFIPGQYVYDLTVVLLIILISSTCLIDTRLNYWTKSRGLHYWNQIRLLTDNCTLIVGAVLYLSYSKISDKNE